MNEDVHKAYDDVIEELMKENNNLREEVSFLKFSICTLLILFCLIIFL